MSWGSGSIGECIRRWTGLKDVKILVKLEDRAMLSRGATRLALVKLGREIGEKLDLGEKLENLGEKTRQPNLKYILLWRSLATGLTCSGIMAFLVAGSTSSFLLGNPHH